MELIFIHIPKTGGRTVEAALKEAYGPVNVGSVSRKQLRRSGQCPEALIPAEKKILHCILWFSELAAFYEKNPAPLITWLRDPVERVISNYYFMLWRAQMGKRPKQLCREDETLMEYAAREGKRNVMVQFLRGVALRDLFFVGLLEYLAEDLNDLGHLLKWTKEIRPVHRNDNSGYKAQFRPVSSNVLKEIRRLNQEDAGLYQEALALREKRRQLMEVAV